MSETRKSSEVSMIRHSKANYGPYEDILKSSNPQSRIDYNSQKDLDLTEAGRALATEKAAEFMEQFDPTRDRFFIVTSKEARAIETANIYRMKAKENGFEIIAPEHTRSKMAKDLGEGELRALDTLSINPKNMLWFCVFETSRPNVNWDGVDEITKQKWTEARSIIEADNKGSWGANYKAYAERMKEFGSPEATAAELGATAFNRIIKLVKWSNEKTKGVPGKNIKILAFGHENHVLNFLEEAFNEDGIKNCEVLKFDVADGGTVQARFRGKNKEVV